MLGHRELKKSSLSEYAGCARLGERGAQGVLGVVSCASRKPKPEGQIGRLQ